MKIYAIAQYSHTVAGHGDTFTSQSIRRRGMYETDGFPPAFTSRSEAEKYLAGIPLNTNMIVTEMELLVSARDAR